MVYPARRYHSDAEKQQAVDAERRQLALEGLMGDNLEMFAPLGMRRPPTEPSSDSGQGERIDPRPPKTGTNAILGLGVAGKVVESIKTIK